MTRAMAPVAAVIIAGRPPTNAIVIAMMNEENNPTFGSTPAMMENEIASGIRARATTRPARASRVSTRGLFSAVNTDGSGRYRFRSSAVVAVVMVHPPGQSGAAHIVCGVEQQGPRARAGHFPPMRENGRSTPSLGGPQPPTL